MRVEYIIMIMAGVLAAIGLLGLVMNRTNTCDAAGRNCKKPMLFWVSLAVMVLSLVMVVICGVVAYSKRSQSKSMY